MSRRAAARIPSPSRRGAPRGLRRGYPRLRAAGGVAGGAGVPRGGAGGATASRYRPRRAPSSPRRPLLGLSAGRDGSALPFSPPLLSPPFPAGGKAAGRAAACGDGGRRGSRRPGSGGGRLPPGLGGVRPRGGRRRAGGSRRPGSGVGAGGGGYLGFWGVFILRGGEGRRRRRRRGLSPPPLPQRQPGQPDRGGGCCAEGARSGGMWGFVGGRIFGIFSAPVLVAVVCCAQR